MHMIAVNAFDYIQAPAPHCWPHLPQRPASWRWSCLCPLSPQLLMLSARHTWHLIFPQENKDELADHMWILAGGFLTRKFSHCCCSSSSSSSPPWHFPLIPPDRRRGFDCVARWLFPLKPQFLSPSTNRSDDLRLRSRGLQCGLVWWGNNVGFRWLLLLVIIRI